MGEKGSPLIRVVLDTNILISSLIFRGELSFLVYLLKSNHFCLLLSKPILEELLRVLSYPKFKLSEQEIKEICYEHVLEYATLIAVDHKSHILLKDLSDNKILECAVSGKADYIVTGDKEILQIRKYQKIPILTAKEFIQKISST